MVDLNRGFVGLNASRVFVNSVFYAANIGRDLI